MVRGLEVSVISNHVLDADQGNAGAPLQSGQHHVIIFIIRDNVEQWKIKLEPV